MKLILTAILFLTGAFHTPSATPEGFDPAKLSEKGQVAYRIVRDAGVFALGGVGIAGTTSAEELAIRTLIAEENGVDALTDLVDHASPESKLMALYGLRCAAPSVYTTKMAELRALPEPPARKSEARTIGAGYVMVFSGCLMGQERWVDVLKQVASATYPCPKQK